MQEFEKCPFGIIGLETAIGLTLEYLVHPRQNSADAAWWSCSPPVPTACCNLDRGTLAAGAPGDVTIFDTERAWTYDVNQSFSKSRNSPFDGHTFRGGPVATIVNGQVVWTADGLPLASPRPASLDLFSASQ